MTELIVMIIYFGGMLWIGFKFKGKVNDTDDFYISGRNLPTWVVTLTFAATFLGASSTMAKSGLAWQVGFPALSVTLACVLGLYVFSAVSPRIRTVGAKYKISSIPELFEKRFGKTASIIAAIIILWTLAGTIGSQMVATSTVLQIICGPWGMSYEIAAVISVAIMVGYTMLSGLYGVAYTDVVQGIILIIGVGVILPFAAINGAGGMAHMKEVLPANFWSIKPDMVLAGYCWVYLLYFLSGPPYWQRALASSSGKGARQGAAFASTIILVYTIAVILVGMAAKIMYPTFPKGVSYEALIPMMVRELYHPLFAAIVLTAIMAAVMSTIDSYLINAAQTLISDIYKKFKPDVTPVQELRLAKWGVVIIGIASLFFSLNIRVILKLIIFAMSFYSAALCAPIFATLYWRKATKEGILASMAAGIAVTLWWSNIMHNPMKIHAAVPGGLASIIVIIVVSLLTYNESKKTMFYEYAEQDQKEYNAKVAG